MNEIILEISALCIAIFCLVDCLKNRKRLYFPMPKTWAEKIRNQHFTYLCLVVTLIISATTSVLEVSMENYLNVKNAVVLYIVNELYFIFHTLLSFLFTLYIINMTGMGKEKGRNFFVLFLTPFFISEALILTNPFTNFIFSITEEFTYTRGGFIWILYAMAGVYVLLGIVFFFMYKKRMQKMDRSATVILIFIAILGIVIQGIWSITVELFFEGIGFLGFMLLLEDRRTRNKNGKNDKMKKGFIIVIALIFLTVIVININLIYHAGTDQTGKIGAIQLENIKGNLQETISDAEENLLRYSMGMEQLLDAHDLSEIEGYIKDQKNHYTGQTQENCFNVYAAAADWTIIPGFDMPAHYHAVERIWYVGAKQNAGKIFISEPYIDAATNSFCFTLSYMLSDENTVTAMDFTLDKIQDTVTMMSKYAEQTAMIVTKEGIIVGSSDEDLRGKKMSEVYPEYLEVFERVKASKEHGSFTAKLEGRNRIVFSNETSNGWQLILIVDSSTFYADIYRQMIMLSAIDLMMVAVIIVFYMVSVSNQEKAENTLATAEGFITGISEDLKIPLNSIIRNSDKMMMEEEDLSSRNTVREIHESGKRLKEMMDNLFSYSSILKTGSDDSDYNKRKNAKKLSVSSRYIRNGIIGIMTAALLIGLVLCIGTTKKWGNEKISKEAEKYNGELTEWMVQHQSILRMFTDVIAADPTVLDDYDSAVKWLNDIGQNYKEMSFCYMANPYNKEHPVIMNNGWVPDPDYRVEERQWYKDTKRSGDGYSISAPYYDAQTGLYCITFSRVVETKEGDFLGIFAIDCYVDKLIDVLDDSYTSEGYAFLIDQDGNIINHPDKIYEMSSDTVTNIEDTKYAEAYHEGTVFGMTDYDGKYVSCYADKSDISGFTVMVVQNWWSVYGTVLFMVIIFLVMLVVSIVSVALLISRFIRWQEEANEKLVESAEAAVSAGKAKSRFLAQMSHEIRTPINAVLGMNEMILRESENDSIREYAENIQSAGRNLLGLINTILDFSKIEEGKMEISPVRYETAAVLGNVVYSIEHRAEEKGLRFETHIDESLPSVMFGDDMRVAQVITNLLTNAVKYTNEGRVDLYVTGTRKDEDHETLFIKVVDTGIGIREEDIDKLFESFTRLDETKNRNIEGTGLGMAIVTRLLDMMGSKLNVKSVYGEGSEFSFEVDQLIVEDKPIGDFKKKAREVLEKRDDDIYIYAPKAKVLAVDDNDMNLKVIKNLMKLNGIVPDLAESGDEAISMMSSKVYDVILLDHMMPKMDGIETLHKAKDMMIVPYNTTVIALTANAVVGAREFYLESGFDDYLSKPVEIKALEYALAKYLPKEIVEYKRRPADEDEKSRKKAVKEEKKKEEKEKEDKKEPEKNEIGVIEFLPEDNQSEDEMFSEVDIDEVLEALEKRGFNTEEGIGYCGGDEDFYIEILSDYSGTVEKRIDELQDAFDKKDLSMYAIKVHALKSIARTAGDTAMFEDSKALEMASKENDAAFVEKNHSALIAKYREIADYIKEILNVPGIHS